MRKSKSMICPNVFTVLRMREEISATAMALACEMPLMNYRNLEHGLDAELGNFLRAASYHGTSVHALVDNDIPMALAERGSYAPIRPETLALRKGEEPLPEGTLCGVRYQRKRAHMSLAALAELAGISVTVLGRIERLGFSLHTRKSTVLALARALHCTVDDLLELHDKTELRPGDRSSRCCRSLCETNLIDNYRVANNLSFRALAAQLGISYQGAYNNCLRTPVNMKYVRILCAREGISLAAFMDKYSCSGLPRTRSA